MNDDQINDAILQLVDQVSGDDQTLIAFAFGVEKFGTLRGFEGAAEDSLKRLEAQVRSQLDKKGFLVEGRDGKIIAAFLKPKDESKKVALEFAEEALTEFRTNALCRTADNHYIIMSEAGAESQGAVPLQNISAITGISFFTPPSNMSREEKAHEIGQVFQRALSGYHEIAGIKHAHLGKRTHLNSVEVTSLIQGIRIVEASGAALPLKAEIGDGVDAILYPAEPQTPPRRGNPARPAALVQAVG